MALLNTLARMWLTRSFMPFHFSNEHDNNFYYDDSEKLDLYVHIPFCRKLCEFCPYCKTVYDEDLARQYVDAVIEEINLVGNMSHKEKVDFTFTNRSFPKMSEPKKKALLYQLVEYCEKSSQQNICV